MDIDYLVVAGGGAGGARAGAGGGAGAVRAGTLTKPQGATLSVTVGAGGVGVSTEGTRGAKGSDSVLDTITSEGGGGGASYGQNTGGTGGSGGGSNYVNTGAAGGTGGNAGGNGSTNGGYPAGGGGGGAGAAGGNAVLNTLPGNGGNGVASSISGASVTYGGGGGGTDDTRAAGSNAGTGGTGGGGAGSATTHGSSGTDGLGGGGGGSPDAGYKGGDGGDGVVIVRYPDSFSAASTTGSPSHSVSGGYHIYTWAAVGSGSITIPGFEMGAAPGSYTVTGVEYTDLDFIYWGRSDPGAYSLAGADGGLYIDRVLNAGAGSISITGSDASTVKDKPFRCFPAGFYITPSTARLRYVTANTLDTEVESYAVTGSPITAYRGLVLKALPGAFAITGTSADVKRIASLNASGGSYALSGSAAETVTGRKVVAEAGDYTHSGSSIGVFRNYRVVAGTGVYSVEGYPAVDGSLGDFGADVSFVLSRQSQSVVVTE